MLRLEVQLISRTSFVLAGGRSSRMRRNKALLEFGGKKLVERACDLGRSVAGGVTIVGAREKFAPYGNVVEDIYEDRGPLGGIYSALKASSSDLNMILAVDMPFLSQEFLSRLLALAEQSGFAIVLPEVGGRLQPLCGVYRRGCSVQAERALQANQNKVEVLIRTLKTRIVPEEEVLRLGGTSAMFANLNTPEQYESAMQLLREYK